MQRPPALAAGRRSAAGPGAGVLPVPQGEGGGTGGMGGGYGSGLSARLTDRPERPSLNPDPALLPVMGVMRRNGERGGDQPGVVGKDGSIHTIGHADKLPKFLEVLARKKRRHSPSPPVSRARSGASSSGSSKHETNFSETALILSNSGIRVRRKVASYVNSPASA